MNMAPVWAASVFLVAAAGSLHQTGAPLQGGITGRVRMLEASAKIPPMIGISATSFQIGSMVSVREDGAFNLVLVEGDYQVSVAELPLGYSIQSITSGSTDLLKDVLRVSSGDSPITVQVVLASPAQPLRGVRVSGRVVNLPTDDWIKRPEVRLSLGGPPGPMLRTPMSPEGAFEFSNVPPGRYVVAPIRVEAVGIKPTWIDIGDRNIEGLIVPLPLQTTLRAHIKAIDSTGAELPLVAPTRLGFRYETLRQGGGGSVGGGPLNLLLPPGDHWISVTGIPEGYILKSMSANVTDLLTIPLHVDATMTPIDMEITLERVRQE